MFGNLFNKVQDVFDEDYKRECNDSLKAIENKKEEDNSDYQICIRVKDDDEYYVDDCKENWNILNNLNNETSCFIYLKDSADREGGILGIRVSEIIAFFPEED